MVGNWWCSGVGNVVAMSGPELDALAIGVLKGHESFTETGGFFFVGFIALSFWPIPLTMEFGVGLSKRVLKSVLDTHYVGIRN
jgi:hypothetical protein